MVEENGDEAAGVDKGELRRKIRQQRHQQKRLTYEDYIEAGLERFIIGDSKHPGYYASIWPNLGSGANTLGYGGVYRLPHLNFNSVLITVISNHWHEGGWHRLQDMMRYTEEQGYTVALEEVDDMSIMPPDAIGIMRACAAKLALDSGFEWCFMLDTDALVEKDTLVRLIRHDMPIVYPLVVALKDDFLGGALNSSLLPEGVGLQPVAWSCMSAMLFNTKVFNCLDAYAWHGHDYHFAQCLAHYGHRIWVDTDTVIHVTRGPARHPTQRWDTLWERLHKAYDSRQNDKRHREPPPGFDPAFSEGTVDEAGVYWAVDKWKYMAASGPMHRKQKNKGAAQTGAGENSPDGKESLV